jgi:hypothetical protein
MTRRKMGGVTNNDGFRIRELNCTAGLLHHDHPELFKDGVLRRLVDLWLDYAGAEDNYQDRGWSGEFDNDPAKEARYHDDVIATDIALDFAIVDIAGSQVWGAFSWVEGPEWLLGSDDD